MASTIRGSDNFDSSAVAEPFTNAGAVGTYAYLTWTASSGYVGGSGLQNNTNYAGSNFEYGVIRHGANIDCSAYDYNTGTPSGTWRSIGAAGANTHYTKTLFYRIS